MWKKKLRNKNKKIKRHSSTPMSLYLGANLSTPLKSPDDSKPPLVSFSAKTPDIIQKHTNCCAPSESLMYWYCELINYYCCFKLTRYESKSHSVVSDSLWPHGLNSPWNSPGQNTGVGSRSLLQGIIPTQGLNPGLPHCKRILYQLSYQRNGIHYTKPSLEAATYPMHLISSLVREAWRKPEILYRKVRIFINSTCLLKVFIFVWRKPTKLCKAIIIQLKNN